ncbi:unnamed protein product [Peronospora belbahrii]|uniref:PX domain-containing protein n=1 Tax=Peronospora belbahrii TaxID=622444 RepID=A0AAU9KPY8_9STRA|nr:unnamed protein product [Peronospora belbahrii]CAH0514180.1 unnamed protein product [Peronospora belbahrii]
MVSHPSSSVKQHYNPPTSNASSSSLFQATGEASRDLQITGVTRRNTSWQYHIEVLDVRASSFNSNHMTICVRKMSMENNSSVITNASEEEQSSVYPDLPPVVRYTVTRRYTDFRQLYNYLVDTHGIALRDALPKFPDGGWISYLRGDDPRLLHYRRERLQRFLRAVDTRRELRWSVAFKNFLRPDLQDIASITTSTSSSTLFADNLSIATSSSSNNIDTRLLPPPPISAPTSLPPRHSRIDKPDAIAVPPVSSSGGYVSLSQLKSPEIRFRKKMVPGSADPRGDLKRRRLYLYSQDADDMDVEQRKPSAKKQFVMALSGALGFKRFVVGVGSGVIGALGRMGSERLDSVETAEYQDDDSDTEGERGSSESACDRNATLLKILSSGGSQTIQH